MQGAVKDYFIHSVNWIIIIIIIIIIKNEKIRPTLCKNAVGAIYIVIQ